ncbi:Atu4866 domain-containing protein [Rhizobium oryzicola]|uniref:Atu4866 domain-containing protein n=1 Tax=Rhizobium oryzicola TaxID=1232668 RepID=A0ABT8STE2_9HYPH|nr:Atu4866 domain-containing protein [Rhizobium oryzicola]MDO1581525.1 Atu4866 domain-containing protein [Rhizobium oryzicola]
MRAFTTPLAATLIAFAAPDKGTGVAAQATHPYVGMWVTEDGRIRQELLPNGRYDEARGTRKSAYQGRYVVTGNHIDYWDDTGFTADGEFIDGVLHHGGMIFYRER